MRGLRPSQTIAAIAALSLGAVAPATFADRALAAAAQPATSASASAQPRATPHATPAATATSLPTPTERARAAFDSIVAGTFERSQLTPAFSAELTAARLDGLSRVLKPLGEPTAFQLSNTRHVEGTTTYDFIVRFAEGPVAFTYGIDDATQKVSRMYVRTTRS